MLMYMHLYVHVIIISEKEVMNLKENIEATVEGLEGWKKRRILVNIL